jgi:dipeptidase E
MRQIIALGGGGFSMEPENPLLDSYILNQSEKDNPKICFIPTASGDAQNYIERFYDFFKDKKCIPSHLSLFKPPTRDLEGFILEKDIIYVGGGNTKNLLLLWKEWGLDTILRKAWDQGIILAGISAGAMCWYEEGLTDSFGDGPAPLTCLGFLKGSVCPHYDSEIERKPFYRQFIEMNTLQAGFGIDDSVAIHFIDQDIHRIVSSRPTSKAYRVSFEGTLQEEELATEYLGTLVR